MVFGLRTCAPGCSFWPGLRFLLAALVGVVVLSNRVVAAQSWVQHTLEVRASVSRVSSAILSAESNQRAFLITGDTAFAEDGRRAQADLVAQLRRLNDLTRDNPSQIARYAQLRPLFEQRIERLNRGAALETGGHHREAVALIANGGGRAIMLQIAAQLDAFDQEEARLFSMRTAQAENQRRILTGLIALAIVLGVALGAVIIDITNRYVRVIVEQTKPLRVSATSAKRPKRNCANRRKWRRSGASLAASRMTLTTCWRSSSATLSFCCAVSAKARSALPRSRPTRWMAQNAPRR